MMARWANPKDPDEQVNYSIDWSGRFVEGRIVSSKWDVAQGSALVAGHSFTDSVTTVYVSGGMAGEKCVFTNEVQVEGTAIPLILQQSIAIRIVEK